MERPKVPQTLIDAEPRGLSVRLYYKYGSFVVGLYSVFRKNSELFHGDEAEVMNFLENYRELPPSFWNPATKEPPVASNSGYFTTSISVITYSQVTKRMCSGYLLTWINSSEPPVWRIDGANGDTLEDVTHWSFLPQAPKVA